MMNEDAAGLLPAMPMSVPVVDQRVARTALLALQA
jgi:hypothetical protein